VLLKGNSMFSKTTLTKKLVVEAARGRFCPEKDRERKISEREGLSRSELTTRREGDTTRQRRGEASPGEKGFRR